MRMPEGKKARAAQDDRPRRSDEALLADACAGDGEAFHELIDRYAGRLFRLACSLVGNAADAEDVVQETLVGAFEHMAGFQARSTVRTWLTRILLRQAARHHRKRSRRIETLPTAAGEDAAAGGRTPADATTARLDVQQALHMLSPKHRQVVVLRELEGMTYDEMADALGVPRGTVESRLFRARQQLKTLLRDYLS
jgi:RNA polymerase sigma-70 factor (ECF subfamily)